MASTSLAEQLKKLAAPHTSLLVQRKKKPSLLFNPSEAASIDRSTFYEIGTSGLNELIEINAEFEVFKVTLFDETSKNFERTIESFDANEKLNAIIKKFLYSLSPYFLLKPTQKVLEWLINRFYIHEYNVDELICAALPYHGTRLFARLIQVFDLKNSHQKWQWLYPVQKKGIPLSKNAIFNHCASDVAFLKMICVLTMEAVEIFGTNASKLTTLFGFYSTTIVGAIQNASELNELHLTHVLPSIFRGLSSDSVDFTASVLIIIAAIFAKVSFHERIHRKLVEKVAQVKHSSLHKSVILLLNILYQSQDESETSIPSKAVKNIFNAAEWLIPVIADFISSGVYPNTFYLLLVRDSLRLLKKPDVDENAVQNFIRDLLSSCRLDDTGAEKLIKVIINEVKDRADPWDCEMVQNLERQYPTAWDNVVSTFFKECPSESLSRILGFTSITSQLQTFEKLNHANSAVRIEAVKYISNNPETVKVKYIKNSLIARWNDENPEVIQAMFMLPKNMRFCSNEIIDQLLLRCWYESGETWNLLLLRVIDAISCESELKNNLAKYTVLLLPFLVSSPTNVKSSILKVDLPFFKSLGKMKNDTGILINDTILNKLVLPSFEELKIAFEELPKEDVYVFTFLLLLSGVYASSVDKNKAEILTFFFDEIFVTNLKKFKWKTSHVWDEALIAEYYQKTKSKKFPREIVYKFFTSAIEHTSIPQHFGSPGWWDFSDEHSNLISTLYVYMNSSFQFVDDKGCNSFVSSFVNKNFENLSRKTTFLCNMCIQHRADVSVQSSTFKMINFLLRNSTESYPWALSMNTDNVLVPCILIFLSSESSELRSLALETVEVITTSISSILIPDISYLELLRYLLQYKEEIILDEKQMPATTYAFLSQDDAVQSLLPASIRCFTKTVLVGLIKHVIDAKTPLSVSARLLKTLEYLKDIDTVEKLVSYVSELLKISNYPNNDASFIVCNVINKFHANNMKLYKTAVIRDFIQYCLKNGSEIKIRTESGVCCVNALILRKLAIDIFDKMENDMKNIILDSVLKICSKCDNVDLISAANSFVKKIALNCESLVPHLENMKNAGVNKTTGRRSAENVVSNVLQSTDWKCGIALLELIQNKKKLYDCHLIMPLLFDVLQKCCEIDDQMTVEYVKQVCLSCALNCSQKLISGNHADIEKLFNVELVVNCIRMSPNPQTHHHALMLLAHCATFAPNRVLHNIMAIFTFMGSSILRQDDAFSFQIISNILETIVPLLVQKTDDFEELSASSITSVLRVFASSIPDIPDHRRIPLLMKLMSILQNGEYLHVFLILTLECCAKCSVNNKNASAKYTEVMQELCLMLPVQVVLSCFQKLIAFVNALPHNTEEKYEKLKLFDELIDLKKYSNKELCHFKYLLLNFVSTVLSNSTFISRVTLLGKKELELLEDYFKGILEHTLLYVKSTTEYSANIKNAPTKYWKVIISQSLEILNKTNALLTNETFIFVTRELLNHDCLTVQRKTMETLNWRLQQNKEDATREHFSPDELISLLPSLMKIVETIWKNSEDDSFDCKFNQQIALISLKLITRYSGATDFSEEFKKILSKLTTAMCDNVKMNDHVMACMILCIAELISSLRIHAIESLPNFMPKFLQLFERYQIEEIAQSDVILLSIITTLQKIIEIIPNFLSPYMEKILYEVCCLTEPTLEKEVSKQKKGEEMKQSNISHKLKLIRQKISTDIPSRVLLPATSACFTKLCENSNFAAVKHLMDILAESFPSNGQFSVELTSLFLNVLDFRCTSEAPDENIDQVEIYVIEALCKIILKCSESTFRPFYHKLYDWGIIASKDVSKKDRVITYYKILSKMSEKLKSVFVIFASNFIRNAVELLDKNNVGKCEGDPQKMYFFNDPSKTVPLVDSILVTFHNIFKYDTIKFLTKDRFNMLVEPLVNQVENIIGDYEKRSSEIIVPCLSRFAAATSDDSLWKQFHLMILMKTRHYSPEVRLTALETVCMFATQLGNDNFSPFLPETVQFLAELLEDENEVVEKQTQKTIQKLEQILGEPIRKYF